MNDQQQSRADGLNEEQREALEWAADRAHVASLGKPVVGIESRRHRALRNLLDALAEVIPEGCTPADARMLREANHALAAENDALRCALRPFARVVSTDKLSWAMVEYCVRGDPEKQTFQAPQMQRAFNRAADILRAESSQPAAPPIVSAPASDARECLMDVVSHHDSIVAGFAAQRLAAEEAQDSDAAAYWKHESDVAHRMKAQAERALAAMAQPAPSPADERAALPEDRIDWIANTHCPGGTAYPVNVKNAIREALREARISDNETGAEGAIVGAWLTEDGRAISAEQKAGMLRDGGAGASSVQPYSIPCYLGAASAMAAEAVAFEITEQAAAEWASRHDVDHVLKHFSTQRNAIEDARTLHLLAAAPQPAQADARVGLTEPKMACRECACLRSGDTCWKCGSETFMPAAGWTEPELPPVARIRELAAQIGYAIGVHGSQERDLDLIAAPWTEDALKLNYREAMQHIADGLGARLVETELKPLGRRACTIQMNGWFKPIDLSVCPMLVQQPEPRAEVTDEPSLTNPLTPYGMLVRALRIVSGTTLMDMADALLTTPAKLSAMEFDREPVTPEFAFDVAAYFDAIGVLHTASALRAAAARTGGQ
ncbi:Uncharacterised protein [Burkholderia pseudomallei]|nr:Uncharacterised protein [Burkholderia pseudomallei]